jgi:anti-sigma factor RsiW
MHSKNSNHSNNSAHSNNSPHSNSLRHCDEFEARLNDLLDRRIAPDDDSQLCSHARRCPRCADRMSAQLAVSAALKDLRPEGPDETFPFAVMNRFEQEQTIATRPRHRQWIAIALATAATGLIALTLWRGTSTPVAPTEVTNSSYDRLAEETQELATLVSQLQSEVMNELAEGFKPVTTSFGAAYDVFRRVMPEGMTSTNAESG